MSILLIFEIFLKASLLVKSIMLVLLALSITSITIIINRVIFFRRVEKQDASFTQMYNEVKSFPVLVKEVNEIQQPYGIANIFKQGVLVYTLSKNYKYQTPDAIIDLIDKKLHTTITEELENQDYGLNILSTITGISPYIGLFGTVWGIIEVFTSLGSAEQVNIQSIAPGISEALVATAMGLFAAIPSLIFYNIFNRKVAANETKYFNFQDRFVGIIQDDVHRRLHPEANKAQQAPAEENSNSSFN